MISSLHLQHFSQYLCSSQQCSLLHHSNIVIRSFLIHPSNSFVTLPRAPITTSTTSTILSFRNLPTSLLKPRFLFLLILHQLVQQYRWISLSLFLVNQSYVWSSCLYHVVTLNIDIPQYFHFFIFYYSFWDVFILFLRVF